MMSFEERLEELCWLNAVEPFYWDINGVQHFASVETKKRILTALGFDASSELSLSTAIESEKSRIWREVLPPVAAFFEDQLPLRLDLRVERGALPQTLQFSFREESGGIGGGELVLSGRQPQETAEIGGTVFEKYQLNFELRPQVGYHRLEISFGGRTVETSIIVAPKRCYQPEHLISGDRLWGVSLQLYALTSEQNLGIGNLSDLRRSVPALAAAGVDVIGLNPLHALFEKSNQEVSPYSPNSRLARNVLLIDVFETEEFKNSVAIQRFVAGKGFSAACEKARSSELVDYRKVWRASFQVFEKLFVEFNCNAAPARKECFQKFLVDFGAQLEHFAVYSAIREELIAQDKTLWGWPVWPEQYRDPLNPAVAEFKREHADRIQFQLYLQFLAEEQLSALSAELSQAGMKTGLYLDLALGTNYGGAELWAHQSIYSPLAASGAPPDELGPLGQNWGLPVPLPTRLREACFEPFIQMLRANMRHAGAVRIDHVMSLYRLFWIPAGCDAAHGAYVRYPFHELLAIVTLESVRARTVVIGEDLGTVPDEVREGMQRVGMLSYKVLYFMHRGDYFLPPFEYPREALVVTSTHDLAPLKSFWESVDVNLRNQLGLISDAELFQKMLRFRATDRRGLLQRLAEEKFIDAAKIEALLASPLTDELFYKFHEFLARTGCMLQVVQLEDVAGNEYQVNVPGTVNEHPNWKRKLRPTLEELLATDRFRELAARVLAARTATRGNG